MTEQSSHATNLGQNDGKLETGQTRPIRSAMMRNRDGDGRTEPTRLETEMTSVEAMAITNGDARTNSNDQSDGDRTTNGMNRRR